MLAHLKKFDWLLLIAVFILCAISLLVLFSIDAGHQTNYFKRQLIFIILGLAAMILTSFLDFRILKNYSSILITLYFILLVILAILLFFGSKIRGAVSWFNFGAINFEPVELAKLIIVLILAKYFSNRHIEVYRVRHIIVSAFYVVLPMTLVLLQPDFGSALILVAIWLGIALLSEIKIKHLAIVIFFGALLILLAWIYVLQPYQKDRIFSLVNPQRDPLGASYNLIQSKIAIGSGGLWGKGLGQGSQGQLNFLPEEHTDFIFAVFAEEWGFLGIGFLLSVYALFFWRLVKLSLASTSNFSRFFASGFAIMVFSQVFINIGMNLGLLPIAGISLPFLSYGGSNLLINFIALGITQNMLIQSKNMSNLKREE